MEVVVSIRVVTGRLLFKKHAKMYRQQGYISKILRIKMQTFLKHACTTSVKRLLLPHCLKGS